MAVGTVSLRRCMGGGVADRMHATRPPQAAMLFDDEADPCWDDRSLLGDLYSEILHQDTCQPTTADGLALVTALAVETSFPPSTGSTAWACCSRLPCDSSGRWGRAACRCWARGV
ncbi:hypothetical protein [Streptomyces sp. NPDC057694]|uniref:hypothetical protein n=1 Tax=Streptomyces sp. NPDC057694 TaxID=3346216 RepID=UPI0036B4C9F4